jgi:exoribonuclease R
MSFIGKIVYSGPIGILHQEKFIKLKPCGIASQVIDQDRVEYHIENQSAVVDKILERIPKTTIGQILSSNSKFVFIHLPLLSPISSIPYEKKLISSNDYHLCHITLDQLVVQKSYSDLEKLIEDYHKNYALDLKLYEKFISQFHSLQKNKSDVLDLTHLQTFHIDPSGSEDIDDFISLDPKQSKIWIHIIDITHYSPIGSKDDQTGFQYGFTWYLPNQTLHLLEPLIEKELYVLTMEMDLAFDEPKVKLYQSKIKNHFDFTYSEIQEILDGKKEDTLGFGWGMQILEKIHPVRYIRQGRKLKWNSKGQPMYEEELLAQRWVAGWMIYYNSWIGKNIRIKDQLVPQRYHPLSHLYDKEEITDSLPDEVKHILWVRRMKQAEYQHQSGHFGLDKEFYTHATSPLRRYFDRWIQMLYFFEPIRDYELEKAVLQHLNRCELDSERISDWVDQQYKVRWVNQNLNVLWEAYVIQIHPTGLEIYVYEIQEIVFVPTKIISFFKKVGEKINVELFTKNHKILCKNIV